MQVFAQHYIVVMRPGNYVGLSREGAPKKADVLLTLSVCYNFFGDVSPGGTSLAEVDDAFSLPINVYFLFVIFLARQRSFCWQLAIAWTDISCGRVWGMSKACTQNFGVYPLTRRIRWNRRPAAPWRIAIATSSPMLTVESNCHAMLMIPIRAADTSTEITSGYSCSSSRNDKKRVIELMTFVCVGIRWKARHLHCDARSFSQHDQRFLVNGVEWKNTGCHHDH